jgi:hypothetical protein
MGNMKDVFERIEEATFRGMGGGGNASAKARAKMDADRAAKRKEGHKWTVSLRTKNDDPGQSNQAVMSDKYDDEKGWVTWWDEDESPTKFRAETIVPGVRGQAKVIGRFSSLEKAKAAIEKELGLGVR